MDERIPEGNPLVVIPNVPVQVVVKSIVVVTMAVLCVTV